MDEPATVSQDGASFGGLTASFTSDRRAAPSSTDRRIDTFLGTVVHVVQSRQTRPNLPSSGCPFCVGGLEAPEPYEVRSFPNRWPALGEGRCEVVLYTPEHDATFASLGVAGARRVIDLWVERTAALARLPDVEFVLVFENRGPEVGATIAHPHGQIYAFDHVPDRPARRLAAGWVPDADPADRLIVEAGGWRAYTNDAPVHPVALTIAPVDRIADLGSADPCLRDGLAGLLVDLFARLDRLYDQPLPYMMWLNQTLDRVAQRFPEPWFNIEVASPWRAPDVPRHIAAAEVACGEYFNPVSPEWIAERLRGLG
jgi:UDPglucose--hexose-1-phosphate uridylyltransferase